jgi:AraC family transcriptional regulator of adaptative response/methylated-DNA-[protein]-cysteine methyltransferase
MTPHADRSSPVKAVLSTGIFCRPECPARPRPQNVRAYASGAEARRAGFRACLRCRPDAEVMRFATLRSPLGELLVAALDGRVAAVAVGGGRTALARGLRADFPHAWVSSDQPAVEPLCRKVLALIDGSLDAADVPLGVRGSPFQRLVWRALVEIPRGETRSYRELAVAIGRPGAARAVGSACAANPAAIAIPCHRAVGSAGELTGYRWGIERKARLLELERAGAEALAAA